MAPTPKNKSARNSCPGPQLSPSTDTWQCPERFTPANRSICPCSSCALGQNTVPAESARQPESPSKTNEQEEQGSDQKSKGLKLRNSLKGLRWSRKQPDVNGNTWKGLRCLRKQPVVSGSTVPLLANNEWMNQDQGSPDQATQSQMGVGSSNTEGYHKSHIGNGNEAQAIPDSSSKDTSKTVVGPVGLSFEEIRQKIDNNKATYASQADDLSDTDYDTIKPTTNHSFL